MDTPRGHLQEGLPVCASQSGVSYVKPGVQRGFFFLVHHILYRISLLSIQGSLVFSCHLLSWTGWAKIRILEWSKLTGGKEPQWDWRVTESRVGSRIYKPTWKHRDTTCIKPQWQHGHWDRSVWLNERCFLCWDQRPARSGLNCNYLIFLLLISSTWIIYVVIAKLDSSGCFCVLENTQEESNKDPKPGPVVSKAFFSALTWNNNIFFADNFWGILVFICSSKSAQPDVVSLLVELHRADLSEENNLQEVSMWSDVREKKNVRVLWV